MNDTFITQNWEGVSFDQETKVDSDGIVYTLIIKGLPEYNQTTVVCLAVMSNHTLQPSGSAVLLIQGNDFSACQCVTIDIYMYQPYMFILYSKICM